MDKTKEANMYLKTISKEMHNISEELHIMNQISIEQIKNPNPMVISFDPEQFINSLKDTIDEIREACSEDIDNESKKSLN